MTMQVEFHHIVCGNPTFSKSFQLLRKLLLGYAAPTG
jgi:hypothetical protein